MKKVLSLSKQYVSVRCRETDLQSFGGNQNFFGVPGAGEEDIRKQKSGCGIVAFADLLLYLGKADRCFQIPESSSYVNCRLSEEEYKRYYNNIYEFMGGIRGKAGISGYLLQKSFNRLAKREKWIFRAKWGLSGRKLHPRVEEMLKRDIPVICCVPMMLLKKDKQDYLSLYQWQNDGLKKVSRVRAHYVMITGINVIEETEFYEVSSWGKRFYIQCREYREFTKKHFMGNYLGNILYIYTR